MSLPSCFRERQNYRGRDRDRANECEREIETEMDSESERVLMARKKNGLKELKKCRCLCLVYGSLRCVKPTIAYLKIPLLRFCCKL